VTWLGVWLVGVGLSDLVRAGSRDGTSRGTVVRSVASGAVAVGAVAVATGLTAPGDLVVLAASLVPLALWVRYSTQVATTGTGHWTALASLAAGATVLVALGGLASTAGGMVARWLAWADLPGVGAETSTARVVLVVGVLLVNLATANVVVRLVLVTVGAMRPVRAIDAAQVRTGDGPHRRGGDGAEVLHASDELRGGRLLGPMERVLIIGLGLAGQLTAAGLVIAAKGLIRFPELQAKRDDRTSVDGVGIDAVTEYFLVGSFVSWLLALASLVLTR